MKYLIVAVLLTLAIPVQAQCYGSSNYYNCYDANSGNSYSVSKFGNQTTVNGYNASTGSTWNQHSNTIGNSTYINGNTNGRTWNETITPYATYGTDSKGSSYYYPR